MTSIEDVIWYINDIMKTYNKLQMNFISGKLIHTNPWRIQRIKRTGNSFKNELSVLVILFEAITFNYSFYLHFFEEKNANYIHYKFYNTHRPTDDTIDTLLPQSMLLVSLPLTFIYDIQASPYEFALIKLDDV